MSKSTHEVGTIEEMMLRNYLDKHPQAEYLKVYLEDGLMVVEVKMKNIKDSKYCFGQIHKWLCRDNKNL